MLDIKQHTASSVSLFLCLVTKLQTFRASLRLCLGVNRASTLCRAEWFYSERPNFSIKIPPLTLEPAAPRCLHNNLRSITACKHQYVPYSLMDAAPADSLSYSNHYRGNNEIHLNPCCYGYGGAQRHSSGRGFITAHTHTHPEACTIQTHTHGVCVLTDQQDGMNVKEKLTIMSNSPISWHKWEFWHPDWLRDQAASGS